MPLLIVKDKEATFYIISVPADSQLRKRDIEGLCDNPYPYLNHPHKKVTA